MDQGRFDDIARLLGATGSRRTGLRAALAGLLGAATASATLPEVDAARRRRRGADDARNGKGRKKCKPKCGPGFECVKEGKQRVCRCPSDIACGGACCAAGEVCLDGQCKPESTGCDPACGTGYACVDDACVCPSGVVCGAACCAVGQACQDGSCGEPRPVPSCIEFGERCKNAGLPCCSGLVCASGPGGETDVACYRQQAGGCTSSAECAYGLECRNGQCQGPLPVEGVGVPCNAAAQQQCSSPGATCSSYTTPGAPAGSFCALPVGAVCTGDPQCTCYRCDVPQSAASGQGRRGERAGRATQLACCQPQGGSCTTSDQCCLGLDCSGGTCGGTGCTVMASQGGAGLQAAIDAAASGAVITIEGGTYDGSASATPLAGFLITKPITLRACRDTGEVILRNAAVGADTVYVMNAGKVALENLTVTSTNPAATTPASTTTGAGVYILTEAAQTQSDVTISGCTVRDIKRVAAVRVFDSKLTMSQTTIKDNSNSSTAVVAAPGASFRHGGGMLASQSVVEISDTLFQRNSTIKGHGGGLFQLRGTLKLTRVTFKDNFAQDNQYGGGLAQLQGSSEIVDSVFEGNTAPTGGGGIAVFTASGYDSPTTTTMSGGSIKANRTTGFDPLNGDGGGLLVLAASNATSMVTAELTGVTIQNNFANHFGGGINVFRRFAAATLDGVEVKGNTVGPQNSTQASQNQYGGAGVHVNFATITIKGNSRITGNTAYSVSTTPNWGGGMAIWTPSVVNIEAGSTIDGNTVTPAGSTLGIGGGIFVFTGTNATGPSPTSKTTDLCGTLRICQPPNNTSPAVTGNTPDNIAIYAGTAVTRFCDGASNPNQCTA